MTPNELLGKSYVFEEDGTVITVIQVKSRVLDDAVQPVVTYNVSQGKSIPRKLMMPYNDFIERFGHLFKS